MALSVVANSKQQVGMGTVMTVMVISLMIIISIATIITRIWQHAGSLLPASVLCCACLYLPVAASDI